MRSVNVLVIDDDPSIRKLLSELLQGRPEYRVLIAGSGQEAVRCFAEEKVDVVLTDIHMPGFTGLELMADMQKIKFKPEILVMTANATPENVETARRVGARSVILKPFDNLDVVEAEIEKAARAAAGRGNGGSGPAPAAGPARAARPTPPPAAAQEEEIPAGLPLDQIPGIPDELVDLFRTAENLEGGRMKVQVPIVCLQTREEGEVVAVLRQVAASLQREFYTWTASKGI